MTLEHQPILILADGGWFSLIVLLLFALSSLLTKKKKKKVFTDEDDSDDIFDAIELEHLPPAIRHSIAPQQKEMKPPPAIPSLIRAVESLSHVPTARRVARAKKPLRSKVSRKAVQPVVQPARRDEDRSTMAKSPKRLAASRLASASPGELRSALVISEILAPPIALREDPAMVRDVRGAI